MTPFRHSNTTAILGAPTDWDVAADGECMGLPIAQAHGTMFSYWRPTWRDRLRVALGSHVRLGVFGSSHPPVTLDTQS